MHPNLTIRQDDSPVGVIVLGMHRSGTSLLSRALIALGVDFGGDFVPPEPDNPKGFFEDKDVNALNVAFLREIGSSWHTLQLPTTYPSDIVSEYRKRATDLLKRKFRKQRLWGLKDPRVTRLLALWEPAVAKFGANPLFVLANRNPLSVTDSLAVRNNMPRAQALGLWALHQIEGLAALNKNGGVVVDYDYMMANPETEIRRLSVFLDREVNDIKTKEFVENFLQRDLRHSHYTDTKIEASSLLDLCMDLHVNLSDFAKSEGQLNPNDLSKCEEVVVWGKQCLAGHEEWMEAVDTINARLESANTALYESEAAIKRLSGNTDIRNEGVSSGLTNSIKRMFFG